MLGRVTRCLATAAVALVLSACAKHGHDSAPYLGLDPDASTDKPVPNVDPCETPNLGCACASEDEIVDCGQVERRSGDYVSCSMGHRTCTSGAWGECIGDTVTTLTVPISGQRTQALGMSQLCTDNPCDPYCSRFVDDSTGLNLPDGGPLTVNGGITLNQTVPLPTGNGCTSLSMTPTPQTVTVTGINTTFVKGEYFNQFDKSVTSIPTSWPVTATRFDSSINFDWGSGAPGPAGIGADGFSVRWTGSVIPSTTEAYRFYTETDDGARLWVNGSLLIDKWQDQGPTEYSTATVSLTAGTPVTFRFEYYENGGGAAAKLRWSSATIAKQIIPATNLGGPSGTRTRLTLSPASPQFNVALLPSGCFSGTLSPVWGLDRYDVATVTNGLVNLISAVPGTLSLTAYTGQFSATGQLNVLVNATDTTAAPSNAVTNFAKTASGTDPMKVLYPYDKTVLPIGLTAPLVQWDTGGTGASAVKLTLSYPATGTPTFSWSEVIAETTPPSATIPQAIWKDFENTGKGQDVKLTLQRVLGSTPATPVSRTLHFSNAPVRGLIYYTQYQRGGSTNMMVADPSSTATAHSAFATVDGCPVCHSLSANGNYFATADRRSSATNGGLSQVQAGGVLKPLADFVPDPARSTYSAGGNDWRGFAWAPLTPDGKYALSANNIWGNTNQSVVGIDTSTRTVSVPSTIMSGGSGTGLLAQYFPNKTFTVASPLWKRIDPLVNFDFGILSPGGLVPLDFSVRRTGQIQAHTSETYLFEIETSDGVKLTVNGTTVIDQLGFQAGLLQAPSTFSGSLSMTAGSKVSIQLDQLDSAAQSSIKLYWSSPSVPRQLVPQSQLYPNDGVHGMEVSYYANNSWTAPVVLKRLEPDINANWGTDSPASEISALPSDNFSSTWQGQLESPYSGLVVFCVDADDGVKVTLGGTLIIDRAGVLSLDFCSLPQLLTQGQKYSLRIDHVERTGSARLNLRWNYGLLAIEERIPTANLYPPATYVAPTTGLTATYYGDMTIGKTQGLNPTLPNAFTRNDPNIYADFGSGRTEYSQLTSSDYWSARWTGLLSAPCTGWYDFQTLNYVDDGGRLWLDQTRVASQWSYGAFGGGMYLTAGDHDFKFDWYENSGGASVLLQWKVNCNNAGWTAIPNSAFKPTGDTNRSGAGRDGGDNGNGTKYTIWQTPSSTGVDPIDVSSATPGNWGLGNSALMVPAFSPDGSKLVFVDGDSAGGAGWRKGLSTFDFDQTGKLFTNRRSIVNTWPLGDALKWPTFESDSHSVIYQSTVPADMCCRNNWTKYGYMGPTNYYEDPGRLWSVDVAASVPTPVALTALNSGERAVDANKAYQPTMAPQAGGGYRWVVYTSTRPYGNTFNVESVQSNYSNTASYTPMTNYNDLQSQLWVSAIDDSPSAAGDRSHPGFWLPNQNYASNASSGFVNERGFWVLEGCKTGGNACEVDEDCCGGSASPKTSVCRLDTPLTDPPTRHCAAVPTTVGPCVAQGGSCTANSDCCTGSVCISGACAATPPILVYGASNYERTYVAACGEGTKPVWRFFDWQTVTPSNSKLQFYAQSSATGTNFTTLPVAPVAVSSSGVVSLGSASGASITSWTGADVGAALVAGGYKSQQYLKITIRLIPNTALTAAPTLTNWRQTYSCVPAE
ncbi:MAG: PA14 domain-containing protein [Myxococcales bacterium]